MQDEPINHRAEDEISASLDGTDYVREYKKAVKLVALKREQDKVFKKMQGKRPDERWRMAVDWLLKTNDDARFEHKAIIKEIADLKADHANKFASTKGDTIRHGLRLPSLVLDTIYLIDPDTQLIWDKGTPHEKRALLHKIMRVFPEYTVPRVI